MVGNGRCEEMEVLIVDLQLYAFTNIRLDATSNASFQRYLHEISVFLIYEALRDSSLDQIAVNTPLGQSSSFTLVNQPMFVPILRAGLGMLDAGLLIFPDATVGFVGAKRDEETLLPEIYLNTIPNGLDGQVVLLDPALATGGSANNPCN